MAEPVLTESIISLGHWLRYWMEYYQQPQGTQVVTVPAGSVESGTWNHALNSSNVCATPLEEPNSYWWLEVVDANNIKMHIASVDIENDHTFRVMVF